MVQVVVVLYTKPRSSFKHGFSNNKRKVLSPRISFSHWITSVCSSSPSRTLPPFKIQIMWYSCKLILTIPNKRKQQQPTKQTKPPKTKTKTNQKPQAVINTISYLCGILWHINSRLLWKCRTIFPQNYTQYLNTPDS